jgi:5-methylcytosine-specific restriction endonuclease McrA
MAVYGRDNSQCQYWHYKENGQRYIYQCTEEDRTIDHVVPKARGGRTSFENCVTACRTCNERVKKNKLPKEAGLELIREPRKPRSRKGEYAYFRFTFNPHKLSHRYYLEKVLKREFSHVAK